MGMGAIVCSQHLKGQKMYCFGKENSKRDNQTPPGSTDLKEEKLMIDRHYPGIHREAPGKDKTAKSTFIFSLNDSNLKN